MASYSGLQVNAKGEVKELRSGRQFQLREIDDPVSHFRALRAELAAEGLANDDPFYALIAADTTHNCNLRCPFCVDDFTYAAASRMSEEDFRKVVAMGELVVNGGLFLSCLYEPFLHPRFGSLLRLLPPSARDKAFFTTNLAVKRFGDEVFESLAGANLNYMNVSVDSFRPEIYERLRVNADFPVFRQNLENLARIFARATAPLKLRFITMALKSNYPEIIDLLKMSHEEFGVVQHEVRLPYGMPYAPREWAEAETLNAVEWVTLEDRISALPFPVKVAPTDSTSRYYPAPVPGLYI